MAIIITTTERCLDFLEENQRELEALAIADSYKEIDEPVLDWEEEFIDNLGQN